jgi:uncharacterized protein YifE (UPF0438 family)
LELLSSIVVDKQTGHAVKEDDSGEIVQLTDEEKDRVAFLIIEICLFIYAKHVKVASKDALD